MKIRTLPINVYRTPRLGDCTNGGISGKYDELLIACPEGHREIDTNDIPENFAMLEMRKVCGQVIPTIYPAEVNAKGEVVKRGNLWYMMGGNYGATSDSRFSKMMNGYYGAVAIHDRYENAKEYEMYSH